MEEGAQWDGRADHNGCSVGKGHERTWLPVGPEGELRPSETPLPLPDLEKCVIFLGHFSLSLDQRCRLTSHVKVFPVGSRVSWGNLEEALAILAQAVCTRCPHTQTKVTKRNSPNQTKPELHQPEGTLQIKQMAKRCQEIKSQIARLPPKDGKVMLRNQKLNGKNTPRGWQRVAQKSKGKWHKCPNCDFPVPLDLWPGS